MIIKSLIQNWPLIWSRRPRSLSGSQKNAVAAPKRHTNTHTHSRKHTHHTLGKYHTRNWPYGNVWAGKCGNSRLWRFATERTPTRIYFRRIAWAVLSGASAFFVLQNTHTHVGWVVVTYLRYGDFGRGSRKMSAAGWTTSLGCMGLGGRETVLSDRTSRTYRYISSGLGIGRSRWRLKLNWLNGNGLRALRGSASVSNK